MKENKSIAEFMGYELTTDGISDLIKTDDYNGNGVTSIPKYDSSWDWLMLAIEKIESMYWKFTITTSGCKIQPDTLNLDDITWTIRKRFNESKLDNTYKAVVEFVKWYKNRS